MGKRGRPSTGPKKAEEIPGQAGRLRRLREAYGFPTANAFAAMLGLHHQTYGAYENGHSMSLQSALRLCQRLPGVTLDWIYFGKPDGMPLDVVRRLGLLDPAGGNGTS